MSNEVVINGIVYAPVGVAQPIRVEMPALPAPETPPRESGFEGGIEPGDRVTYTGKKSGKTGRYYVHVMTHSKFAPFQLRVGLSRFARRGVKLFWVDASECR